MVLERVFRLVGIAFGALFVIVNAPDLPGAWPWIARAAGAVLVVVALVVVVRGPTFASEADDRAVRIYWIAVVAELIAIPVGSLIINRVIDRPELTVTWVVFVVGAHFLPARSFGFARWTVLGLVLITLAIVGAVGTVVVDDTWAPAAAVTAGLVMLAFAIGTSSTGARTASV